MQLVVFDCLQRFCSIDNGTMIEGYDGYRLEENTNIDGYVFIVYGLLSQGAVNERRFAIKSSEVKRFMQLYSFYSEQDSRRSFLLLIASNEVPSNPAMSDVDLFSIARKVYNKYYLHFISMNYDLYQFLDYCKERNSSHNLTDYMVS